MSAGRADFGGDPHLVGKPTTSGKICWSTGSASGAILEGQLYYDDLFTAGCAHINAEFRTAVGGQLVSRYVNRVCSTGGLKQKSVFSQVNGNVRVITIRLFTSATANGAQTSVGTKTFGI